MVYVSISHRPLSLTFRCSVCFLCYSLFIVILSYIFFWLNIGTKNMCCFSLMSISSQILNFLLLLLVMVVLCLFVCICTFGLFRPASVTKRFHIKSWSLPQFAIFECNHDLFIFIHFLVIGLQFYFIQLYCYMLCSYLNYIHRCL